MIRASFLLVALFAETLHAETYLCVAEAGAVVEHGGSAGIHASVVNVSERKFIQTDEAGEWVVKALGQDFAVFDDCTSAYFCERSTGYAGVFMRDDDGVFLLQLSPKSDPALFCLAVCLCCGTSGHTWCCYKCDVCLGIWTAIAAAAV
jgi:hypothetical protein